MRRHSDEPPADAVPVSLKMGIANFGPVSKGSVTLRPLTIFVGPNNSGKSYVAMLVHSFVTAANKISPARRHQFADRDNFIELCELFENDIQNMIKQNRGKKSFEIPTNIAKKIFDSIAKERFAKNLECEITRNFGAPLCDLVRAGQNLAKITVSNSRNTAISISKKLDIKTDLKFDAKYKVKISKGQELSYVHPEENNQTIQVDELFLKRYAVAEIMQQLMWSIGSKVRHDAIPTNSLYFPAARSGILQGHKALSASIISSAQFGGIQSFQIPMLTGVVSDFISKIILIPEHKGHFYELAQELEADLLHGHIKLPPAEKGSFPQITYQSGRNKIPLHRTSSTISEIAPLSLYLKHIVEQGSLLIIEEPESHLHPANQLVFAKHIVRMIRAGLRVLITTHSVFLLEQLGKFMLASKVKPAIRKRKLGFAQNDFLSPDEVSPYAFVKKEDNDHYIMPIETNDEDGISQEEFVRVNELIHSESIRLQESMPGL